MKKIFISVLAAAITAVMFSACGNNDTKVEENMTSPGIMATASPTASPSEDKGKLSFKIENKTGTDFEAIYISEGSMEKWDDSLLPSDGKFEDGNTISVSVKDDDTVDDWDIKAEDADGNFVYWQKLDLRNAEKITLKIEDGKPSVEIK